MNKFSSWLTRLISPGDIEDNADALVEEASEATDVANETIEDADNLMDELMKDYDSETDIPSDLSDIKDTCEFERRKFCVLKTIKSCFRFNWILIEV